MDLSIIKKAGLSESQAKAYLALIEHSNTSPAELAQFIGETRTNAYAIIDRLLQYGLINKKQDVKYGAKYNANHPSSLEALAENRRKVLANNEKAVKDNISGLIDYFYSHTEMPGTRTLQGLDGIKTVYTDELKTKGNILLLRSIGDKQLGGWLAEHTKRRVEKGVKIRALMPMADKNDVQNIKANVDETRIMERTIIPKNMYTAPVEINVYDDKVALIAFGDTQMATLIESPAIAECFKQIFELLFSLLKDYSAEIKSQITNGTYVYDDK